MAEQNTLCMVEAINLALHRAMAGDPDVVVLGEDVGPNGGVFRATLGLYERFGFRRVMDTPLAETLITDRKSTRLNSSHVKISYAVFCLKKKNRRNKR